MEKISKELIRQGEGTTVEFKKTVTSYEKIAKTVSSLANTQGGVILVGVSDQKAIVGVRPAEEEYVIDHAAHYYCEPPIDLRFVIERVQDRQLLLVFVPDSPAKPHACVDKQGDLQYYVRVADQSVHASDMVVNSMKRLRDERTARSYSNNEQRLFDFLHRKRRITMAEYAKLINVSKRRANKILLDLVYDGELFLHDYETRIFFTLAGAA
jgi:predicted HTH transcriptional regulator